MGAVGAAAPTDFEKIDFAPTDFEKGWPGNCYFYCKKINFLIGLVIYLKICTHCFEILKRPLRYEPMILAIYGLPQDSVFVVVEQKIF